MYEKSPREPSSHLPTAQPTCRPRQPPLSFPCRKIKLENLSCLSTAAKCRFFVHVCHTSHHKFTTKNTTSAHHFSQNTPQKRPKTAKNIPATTPNFFCNK